MALEGEYLDMPVYVDDLDQENLEFYSFCGNGELRLQQCSSCGLKRYPPTTACPWCANPESSWEPVAGRGTLYSYGEVHHAFNRCFVSLPRTCCCWWSWTSNATIRRLTTDCASPAIWPPPTATWRHRNWSSALA